MTLRLPRCPSCPTRTTGRASRPSGGNNVRGSCLYGVSSSASIAIAVCFRMLCNDFQKSIEPRHAQTAPNHTSWLYRLRLPNRDDFWSECRKSPSAAPAGRLCILLSAHSRGGALPSSSRHSKRGSAPGPFSGRCSSAAVRLSLNLAGPAAPGLNNQTPSLQWCPYTWLCPKMMMSGLCCARSCLAAGVSASCYEPLALTFLLTHTALCNKCRMSYNTVGYSCQKCPPLGGMPYMCVMRMCQPFTCSTCTSGKSSRLAPSTLPLYVATPPAVGNSALLVLTCQLA